MNQSKVSKNLLFLSILTVITVFVWIGFDTYRALTKTEIPQVLQGQLEPLNPEIDTQTIKNLSNRQVFKKEDLSVTIVNEAPTPTPTSTSND